MKLFMKLTSTIMLSILLVSTNPEIYAKKDGTSYADEYIALMDAGSPNSTEYEIQDIVLEEVSAFFLGEKTEQDVAKIIQHRVQLYLDERQ